MNGSFYSFGDAHQSLDRNDFLSALNFPKVFRIQIHLFSQCFLGQIGLLSARTNGLTNYSPVLQNVFSLFLSVRHNTKSIGALNSNLTPATCWYFLLVFQRWMARTVYAYEQE